MYFNIELYIHTSSILPFQLEVFPLAFLTKQISWFLNSFSFCLPRKVFIFSHFWRTVLLDIVFLVGFFFFPLKHLTVSSHWFVDCKLSTGESTHSFMGISLVFGESLFSCCFQFFLCLTSENLIIMCLDVYFFGFSS